MTAGATPTRAEGVGLRSERGPILLSLMLSTALVALDATILATAATTIAREFDAFALVPWLFSAYTLAQAVTVPVYGRLSDVFGRKRLMLLGVGLFLIGSVLCALAPTMLALILARVVQGLGAGAIMPMSMTIASDIYTVAERAKAQGYLASVWAISSVAGPTLGGVFSQFVSWRWIFWVNVPLAVLAAVMLWRRFTEPSGDGEREPVDYLGATLLTGGSTLLVLGLLQAGEWGWGSARTVAVLAGGVVLLALFVFRSQRVRYPILRLAVLRRRVIAAPTVAAFMIGVIVLGLSTYVPIYAQGVLDAEPLVAGFALAALSVGWPLTATLSGRVYLRVGFRITGLIGSALVVIGSALALLLGEHTSIWQVAATCFVIGAGMGLTTAPTLIAAQTSVDWSERGAVTGTNVFSRSLGSAVGVAAFGGVVNAVATVGPDGMPVGADLVHGVHLVFWCSLGVAVLLALAVALMPRDRGAVWQTPKT
ncbi:MDR family MFS transporter [Ruania zhangjianzhongii]|uniref:MDR family MFS transporter n=1 Tax=Ruania zhangjianzhongii TaxID=2603206 RepID=UPI0011C82296|nr:MDR family MFS transporter [Ruania zhangjianzhongii]